MARSFETYGEEETEVGRAEITTYTVESEVMVTS
jgi:hypothetical protein